MKNWHALWYVGMSYGMLTRKDKKLAVGMLARKPSCHASTLARKALAHRPRWHAGTHGTRLIELIKCRYQRPWLIDI